MMTSMLVVYWSARLPLQRDNRGLFALFYWKRQSKLNLSNLHLKLPNAQSKLKLLSIHLNSVEYNLN